jgi:hypothetical protein
MNPNKFYQRIKLFNDIIYEIFNTESNYRTELSMLNLKLLRKIEEHQNEMYIRRLEKRQTVVSRVKTVKYPEKNGKLDQTLKTSKSKDNMLLDKEENPMIDKLMSESLQHLLAFYKTKHKLISKEVSDLGIVIYNFSSSQKKLDNYEDYMTLENFKENFDINYAKYMKIKKKYFDKMNNLEIFLHEEEDNKIKLRDAKVKNGINPNMNAINQNSIEKEKEKIDELILLRQKYKKYLTELTHNQKLYIAKINEIGNDMQQFNINENKILFDIFKIFEENIINLLKEINNYCLIYEANKKLIKDINIELGNNIIFDERIYINYQFEEYNPKFADINNPIDFSVIQKMNKLIGFEFDKIKTNKRNHSKEENILFDSIQYNNIDDNLLFILLMDKFTDGENILNEKEIKLMKHLFNQDKYIYQFLSRLNKIRINKQVFSKKDNFNILLDFFNLIYSKISLTNDNSHQLIKFLMILSETFYYKFDDKKIFLNSVIKTPKELKESNFWIKYIELEIKIESKNYDKKNARYEYIVLLSNTTHLKEYSLPKEEIKKIIKYFQDKFKISKEEIDIINGQLNI